MNESATRSGYVALIGRPNAGKSTLLNCILGQKLAIVSHKAQTTRHRILGIKTGTTGQVVWVDTPGIHLRGEQALNRYLNKAARDALADVDLAVFVVPALSWNPEDESVLRAVRQSGVGCIAAVNKVDRIEDKQTLLPYLQELSGRHRFLEIVPVSARSGFNVGQLESVVLRHLPEGPRLFPDEQLTDRSERFFAAELIREQLTRRYHAELPYALTVEIERFEETERLYRIAAVLWVERDSQKAILLGKGGRVLKETATQARHQLERFFDRKVYLQLWIKVKKSWSSDEKSLASLGYTD